MKFGVIHVFESVTKKPELSNSMERLYNILYKGRKIYQNLTAEECSEILQEFSESYYSGKEIDPNLLEMEEI